MDLTSIGSYLKKHTEALVKDVGVEPACEITGKSKATLGLEKASSYPHVTAALAEMKGISLSHDDRRPNTERKGGVNADVIALSQRFAMLMGEYQQSIDDGVISVNEAKRLLQETIRLQQVLIDMKLNLEAESG